MFTKKLTDIQKDKVTAGKNTYMQVLISSDEAPHFAMRKFTIESGGSIPEHTNEVEHEQFVLSGCARIGIGNNIIEVEQNDIVFIPARTPHWYKNIGSEPFEFLCIVPNKIDEIKLTGK